jgi:hypothetical protein
MAVDNILSCGRELIWKVACSQLGFWNAVNCECSWAIRQLVWAQLCHVSASNVIRDSCVWHVTSNKCMQLYFRSAGSITLYTTTHTRLWGPAKSQQLKGRTNIALCYVAHMFLSAQLLHDELL